MAHATAHTAVVLADAQAPSWAHDLARQVSMAVSKQVVAKEPKDKLPPAVLPAQVIYIPDATAGATIAYSDGTTWHEVWSKNNAATLFDDTVHGDRAGGSLHPAVTTSVNGFMTAADKTKIDGIESGATADQTAAEILTAIKTVDGAASGLDADLLDNIDSAGFVQISGTQTITGAKTFSSNLIVQDDGGGLLRFNDAAWGGRVGRILATAGDWYFRPTSAADTDASTKDFFYNNTNDRWQFDEEPFVGNNAVMHAGKGLANQTITLADDAATSVTLPANCGIHFILAISTANALPGSAMAHISISLSTATLMSQSGTGYEILNGTALTGTTGTDVKVTIGVTASVLYIENRAGASRIFSLSFLANR